MFWNHKPATGPAISPGGSPPQQAEDAPVQDAGEYIATDPCTRLAAVWITVNDEKSNARRVPMTWRTRQAAVNYLWEIHGRAWPEFCSVVSYAEAQREWAEMARRETMQAQREQWAQRRKWA